jgi:hypothetical protein
VATSVVVVNLQEQLLARERELDSREGTLTTWEDGLVDFEHTLERVCTECVARHVQDEAAQQDYLFRTCAFSSRSKR